MKYLLLAGLAALIPTSGHGQTPSQADVAYTDQCLVAVANGLELNHPGWHLTRLSKGGAEPVAYQLVQQYGDRDKACRVGAEWLMDLATRLEG